MIYKDKRSGDIANIELITSFPASVRGVHVKEFHPYSVSEANGNHYCISKVRLDAQFELLTSNPQPIKLEEEEEKE